MKRYFLLILIPTNTLAFEPTSERQQTLLNLLKHDCGACHGLKLKGGLGPALLPETLEDKSNAYLLKTIQEGRPGTAMPPWKRFISKDESIWLIENILKRQ